MKSPAIAPTRGRLFRVRQAAEFLGCSIDRVRRLIRDGELVVVRSTSGRLDGIYESDCEAYLDLHRTAVPSPTPRPSGDERIAHLLPQERRF